MPGGYEFSKNGEERTDTIPLHDDNISKPEYRIVDTRLSLPIFVECKKIEPGTSRNRLPKIIQKANSQIKSAGEDAYGVLFVDVSNLLFEPHFGDIPSEEIKSLTEYVQRSLKGANGAISTAILFWDEFKIFEQGGDTPQDCSFATRRTAVLHHENPRFSLPGDCFIVEYGYTLFLGMVPRPNYRMGGALPTPRNSPCHCGSGRRFKECHGRLT